MTILTGCVARSGNAYRCAMRSPRSWWSCAVPKWPRQPAKRVQASGKVLTSEGAAVPADQVVHAAQVKVLERGCSTTTRPAGSGSRARPLKCCAPRGTVSGPSVAHRAMIAGVRVEPGSAEGAKAITSRGDDESDKPDKPHKRHKPPIRPGR